MKKEAKGGPGRLCFAWQGGGGAAVNTSASRHCSRCYKHELHEGDEA